VLSGIADRAASSAISVSSNIPRVTATVRAPPATSGSTGTSSPTPSRNVGDRRRAELALPPRASRQLLRSTSPWPGRR
jgi:hypothetical protein